MKKLLFIALLLLTAMPFSAQAQKKTPAKGNNAAPAQKKWGLTWETPKNWTRSAVANGLKFESKDESDYILLKAFDLPLDDAAKQEIIAQFADDEADISDYAEFSKEAKNTTLNGLKVVVFEDNEEPDLEEAEEPDDYEGYWTKIIILEHDNKLILISLSETYMRKRKKQKDFDEIYKSIRKG
jgi:hypothetical protein